ncbi:hypothetical protein MWU52_05235 [Jannaschia sp. S6380]|uniref:hypothetical protein n=1 Tax=Jannaschia sp. S6380 TaxID=2926408 RepID=UPI001FF3C1B2|nr:hypothetical protein [Jannaschia sp. S6380]MCK0166951.1 hypothetical protein [Jannaschia sp. S6380]
MKTPVISVILLALVAGCNSNGDDNGLDDVANLVSADLDSYRDEGERLSDEYEDARATPIADLPTGSATYTGVGVIDTNPDGFDDEGVIGRSVVRADFDDGTVTAELGDFLDIDGDDVDGRVEIEDGDLSNGVITGALSGDLAGGDVSGSSLGEISGANGEAVGILINGRIDGGDLDGNFDGAIIADR